MSPEPCNPAPNGAGLNTRIYLCGIPQTLSAEVVVEQTIWRVSRLLGPKMFANEISANGTSACLRRHDLEKSPALFNAASLKSEQCPFVASLVEPDRRRHKKNPPNCDLSHTDA
jgi:hypothetical protein